MPFSEGFRIITISRDSCGEMAGTAAEKASSPRQHGVGAAGDARDVRGHERLGQAHGREDSHEPPRQPRLPYPRGPQHQNVMDTIPPSPLPSRPRLGVAADHEAGPGAAPAAVPAGS
jgi:hypothetical protein